MSDRNVVLGFHTSLIILLREKSSLFLSLKDSSIIRTVFPTVLLSSAQLRLLIADVICMCTFILHLLLCFLLFFLFYLTFSFPPSPPSFYLLLFYPLVSFLVFLFSSVALPFCLFSTLDRR